MHRGYEPTPDQIRQGCLEIQAGWSDEVDATTRTALMVASTAGWPLAVLTIPPPLDCR